MVDEASTAPPTMICRADVRTWEDLRASGLLWLINRQVFHPRGYALGVVYLEGKVAGWQILGDGRKPWRYTDDTDEAALLAAAQATLTERSETARDDRASEVATLRDQRNQLVALVGEILRHFTQRGHPGRPCLRTGWIQEETANGWRERLATLTGQEAKRG
ncbi:hypothetical protein ACIBBG_32075 [Micromonospora chersina]|uniref:hypothetical protein n=1 Tax=Micromonospora chersina TaxID=47854 RepID=UPI0037AB2609